MRYFLRSFAWLAIAIVQQWTFHRTGIVWFALGAAGSAVVVGIEYLKFVRTLDDNDEI